MELEFYKENYKLLSWGYITICHLSLNRNQDIYITVILNRKNHNLNFR